MQSLFSGAEKLGLKLVFWLKKPDPRRFKLKSPAGEEALHFMGGGSLPPPLTREEEERLVERLPDPAVKETLITRNLRLVVYIARKFEGGRQFAGGPLVDRNNRPDQGGRHLFAGQEE